MAPYYNAYPQNCYPTNYQPYPAQGYMGQQLYQQPVTQPTQPTQQPLFQSSNGINWVQGEAGAKAYPVAANNSVLLMDTDDQCFYIKSADQSGLPTMRRFAYSEVIDEPLKLESHDARPRVDMENLATKDDIRGLEQKIAELHDATLDARRPQQMPVGNSKVNGGQKNG